MKKTLYIFLISLFFSIGCSTNSDTVQPTTNLDPNLFGVWTCNEYISYDYIWTLTFLENGTFTDVTTTISTNIQDHIESGTWIVQNQSLFFDFTNDSYTDNGDVPYSIQIDTLTQVDTLTLDVSNSGVWEEGPNIFTRQN